MKRNIVTTFVALLILLLVAWFTCRVPYHKWRWRVSLETAERLRAGDYTRSDAFFDLLRRNPKTYQDYETAAAKHESALVRLGHLVRKEFRLATRVRTDAALARFTKQAAERFPNRSEWSALFSTTGDSVIITTTKERIPEWDKFIAAFDAFKKAKRNSKCKRSRSVGPVQVLWQ